MTREHWSSRFGFIMAVAGSAIGLGNIWRFPYITGTHGGAAFISLYLLCLILVGIPAFLAEITIGRKTQTNPASAFGILGKNRFWDLSGKMTIVTGFIVSAFYSVVAGWIFGYFIEAVTGTLAAFTSHEEIGAHYHHLLENPWWGLTFHFLFILFSVLVLYLGVKNGIERCNKFFMPVLLAILVVLLVKGFTLPNSLNSIKFLMQPNWALITPWAFLTALGHSFFTLSVGQGTLVTYGSYLSEKENILKSSYPIVLMDTFVSIAATFIIFTIVFSIGMSPDAGPSLLFKTLPWVFSQIPGGYLLSVLFFSLVVIAALTSEISALEPAIAYLTDNRGFSRHKAVLVVGLAAFLVGVPMALSTSLFKEISVFGYDNFLEFSISLCSDILIPLGGLAAVLLLGWKWGTKAALEELRVHNPFLAGYLKICFRYISPALIIVIFLHAIGLVK